MANVKLKKGIEFVGDIIAGCVRCKTVRYDAKKKKWICSWFSFGKENFARFTSKQIHSFIANPRIPSVDVKKLAS